MDKIKYFDGGMGSMLCLKAGELPEQLNITDPDRVLAVHNAYANAGADIILANTFSRILYIIQCIIAAMIKFRDFSDTKRSKINV